MSGHREQRLRNDEGIPGECFVLARQQTGDGASWFRWHQHAALCETLVILCLQDRAPARSGAESGLLRVYDSAFPGVNHWETFCLHPCTS